MIFVLLAGISAQESWPRTLCPTVFLSRASAFLAACVQTMGHALFGWGFGKPTSDAGVAEHQAKNVVL